jgi:enoyl-CoA hydratase/carnithine racemase
LDPVSVTRDGAVATVTLNNPERLNALSAAMWKQLGEIFRALDADQELRCIVIRGAGDKAFAAGADISEFANERANAAQAKRYGEDIAGSMRALAQEIHSPAGRSPPAERR